jgi:hypothetical protein
MNLLIPHFITGSLIVLITLFADTLGQDVKKVELRIDLPIAVFDGTPKPVQKVNLDPVNTGKKRKPFFVPEGTRNVAFKKTITASDSNLVTGQLDMITDGDKNAADGSFNELGPGIQWVQVDLGSSFSIYAVVIWHYHKEARVYRDVVVQLADDADFITNVKTIFNNDNDSSSGMGVGKDYEYIETNEGKLIDAMGAKARYVRLYTCGSTAGEMNNYIEVEVYGK